jgi:hypothetical protein
MVDTTFIAWEKVFTGCSSLRLSHLALLVTL